MRKSRPVVVKVVTAAITAGVVAAGVAYLLHKKPEWRKHVASAGRFVLNTAEGLLKRS
ncbi:MAG: hypothetical protein ACYDBB_07615 [Armatimonadota bacterium]